MLRLLPHDEMQQDRHADQGETTKQNGENKTHGHASTRLCPKKGVWNFQALETPAFIRAGEFQTPFFRQSPSTMKSPRRRLSPTGLLLKCVLQRIGILSFCLAPTLPGHRRDEAAF